MSLKGKIAIVTGAARGIGAGIVRALAKEGASVRNPEMLSQVEIVIGRFPYWSSCLRIMTCTVSAL